MEACTSRLGHLPARDAITERGSGQQPLPDCQWGRQPAGEEDQKSTTPSAGESRESIAM